MSTPKPTHDTQTVPAAKPDEACQIAAQMWWDQWSKSHQEQIMTYNDEIAKAGVWSDQSRLF